MKTVLKTGITALALSTALPARAQAANDTIILLENPVDPTMLSILVTGSNQRIDQSGQSVTAFGQRQIDAVQGPDLTRLIERAPGDSLVRNGGLGAQTSLFVRGASSEQTLVLLDGVRLTDVASPGGGTDLGTVSLGALGKVELLRGSNSVVWGSDAVGGVLALTSRRFTGLEASAEGGSHGTFNGDATAGITGAHGSLSLTGGTTTTTGISAAAIGTEADGYRQARIAGSGDLVLTDRLSLIATARYAWAHLDIDGFPPPNYTFADTPEYQVTKQASGRVGLRYRGADLDLDAGYALSDTRRAYFDPTFGADPNFTTSGRSERADLSGHWRLPHDLALDFGADRESTRFSTLFDAEQRARLTSGHALLGYYGGRATLAAGVRIDDHSRFGSKVSLGANGSLRLGDNLRLTASYGEGFKAPTLYQLFSNFGTSSLQPERSRSYDAGVEYGQRSAPFYAAITLFRRDTRNLIDFISCFGQSTGICTNRPFGTYANVGTARAEGIEAEASVRPSPHLTFAASATHLVATNRTPGDAQFGRDLARRPRDTVTFSADWTTPWQALKLGADLRLVSRSFDDGANTLRLDGYQLATLRAELPLTTRITLFGRIENLFNERYQTVAGYGTYRRSAYAGARARW